MSMKRLALFFLTLMMGLGWAVAQNRTVTGTVVSSTDNEPLIGASVVVVGQPTIGTTTDFDGKFKLSVPANAKKLRFSYVGMQAQEHDIENVMNIVLSDSKDLDVVVVVGYGSGQKLSTVSGSVARVSGEKLENKPVANVMDGLQGQVAGMQVETGSGDPNAVASVQIHGNASLGAGGSPLYIVDGVQTSAGVVMAMNPSDFESITVLKDASSTSIYGARAANGVIVITTKRGKLNQDGQISVSTMYGVSSLISRRPFEHIMSAQELLKYQMKHRVSQNDGLVPGSEFLKGFKGTAFAGEVDADGNYTGKVLREYDWLNVFMGKHAPTFQTDMSIAGGSDNVSYYVSGGYFSQEGISAETSRYRKFNLRSNIDARVKEWLRVGMNVSGGLVQQEASSFQGSAYVNSGTFAALTIPAYYSPFVKDANGNDMNEYARYIRLHKSYPVLTNTTLYLPSVANETSLSKGTSYRLNASGYAQLRPIEGLTLKTQAGIDMIFGRDQRLVYPENPDVNGLGFNRQSYDNSNTLTWTNTAEYKFKVKEDHDFTALLGQEFVDNRSEGFTAMARGLRNRDYMFLGHGQLGSFLVRPSQSSSAYAYFSLFARLNYTFKDYMAFDVTVRNDRSSRFGRNHQAATFFSVGAMYDFLRSGLVDDKGLISTLRLKANYGTQGNSSIPLYASEALTGTINYTEELAFGVTSIGNPDLAWERQGMFSVGVDYGMWDNTLTVDLAYYNRKTTDMLMNVPLPYSTGYGARWQNVGAMTNQGVDLTLQYNFLRLKDWNAYVSATFNYNDERIDKLFSDKTNKEGYAVTNIMKYNVGKPIVYHIPVFAGINENTGKQMWYDKDGNKTDVYSSDLRQDIDYARISAPISGGVSMGVTWKNQLSFNMDWTYTLGAYSLNNDRFFLENNVYGFSMMNRSKKLLDEWTEDNPKGTVAKFGEDLVFDTRLLENASYLRLKNIQLSYTFPKTLLGSQKIISGVKVYVSSRNLLTFVDKSYTGFDPEAGGGVSLNAFPNTRQFVGGLQLMF